MQLITLTTDFGFSDWFVGTMKGVILSIIPLHILGMGVRTQMGIIVRSRQVALPNRCSPCKCAA